MKFIKNIIETVSEYTQNMWSNDKKSTFHLYAHIASRQIYKKLINAPTLLSHDVQQIDTPRGLVSNVGVTKEGATGWVNRVEAMLVKEQDHLSYLEANKSKVADVLDITSMIDNSKKSIAHLELRLKQYKKHGTYKETISRITRTCGCTWVLVKRSI